VAIGEELNGVNVGLVAGKGLDGLACSDIPELGERVAGTGDEGVLVCGVQADAHNVAEMVGKLVDLLARLDIPLHAGHVAGRGQDAPVVDEAAARQVAGVARQLTGDARGAVALLVQVVDGADVVETTACDKVSARGVGASHDPGRTQGDGVDLVGCVGVPDNELAVLGGGDEVPSVGGPVHGVDLGQMTLESAFRLHQLVLRDGLVSLLSDGADLMTGTDGLAGSRATDDVVMGQLTDAAATRSTTAKSSRANQIKGWSGSENVRVVSASSSFFLLMRSLRVSASRRACWMRACMASGDTSELFEFMVRTEGW
jgi:hypothetical protein